MKPVGYSDLYEHGLRVATVAHRSQDRKGSNLPYITHPIHVSVILLNYGFSPAVAVAGLLHDVVEDQGYKLTEIQEEFGPQVAEIVDALSERKRDAQGKMRPWDVRKRDALAHLRQASIEAVAVKAADTLHNSRCFAEDLRQDGDEMWQHFNRGPDAQMGYYLQVLQIVQKRLGPHPLAAELAESLNDLTQAIQETEQREI